MTRKEFEEYCKKYVCYYEKIGRYGTGKIYRVTYRNGLSDEIFVFD